MRIRVIDLKMLDDHAVVDFQSSAGTSRARWIGDLPFSGEDYDVEIEIGDQMSWGENISMSHDEQSSISFCENVFILIAEVVSLADDGCLAVSLDGSVILLELEKAPDSVSGFVECKLLNVALYSENL